MASDIQKVKSPSGYLPSTWKRLAAVWIDEVLMIPCYLPFAGIILQLLWGEDDVDISLLKFILFLMIPLVYEFVFLVLMQATPGKWLLGLTVVPERDVNGFLEWPQCFLRALMKRLSLFLGMAIYAVAFFRYDRTHLADWVAETRVVQANPRAQRPRIRWILGSLFVIYFAVEGWRTSHQMVNAIDWKEGRVNLRAVMSAYTGEDMIEEYSFEEESDVI